MTYHQDLTAFQNYRQPGSAYPPEVDSNILLLKINNLIEELTTVIPPSDGVATEATQVLIKDKAVEIKDDMVSSLSTANSHLDSSNNNLGLTNTKLNSMITALNSLRGAISTASNKDGLATDQLQVDANSQLSQISTYTQNINNSLSDTNSKLTTLNTVQHQDLLNLENAVDALTTTVSSLSTNLTTVIDNSTDDLTDVKNEVIAISTQVNLIKTQLTSLATSLGGNFQPTLIAKLTELINAVNSITGNESSDTINQVISITLASGGNNELLLTYLREIRDYLLLIAIDNHQAMYSRIGLILQRLDSLTNIEYLLEAVRVAVSTRYGSWQNISECTYNPDS